MQRSSAGADSKSRRYLFREAVTAMPVVAVVLLLSTGLATTQFAPGVASAYAAVAQEEDDKESKSATPEEQFQSLSEDYQKEFQEFLKEYRAAEPEAQQKMMPQYFELLGDYAKKFDKLATDHPNSEAAGDALLWIIQQGGQAPGGSKLVTSAVERFISEQGDHPQLPQVLASLSRVPGVDSVAILRKVIETSDSPDAKGTATYYLAKSLIDRASRLGSLSEEQEEKVVAMLRQAKDEYGDVRINGRKLADIVEPDLFELLHLSIGKEAPEIAGEDIDGADMKLTEYRGKVVVLDFWGHW